MLGVYNYTVLLTYIGMLTGLTGIGFAMGGRIPWALLCLLLAGLCDMFDGKIASTKKDRTPQEKRFGVQIDSLSDLICFGVLPGVTVYAAAHGALYAALAAGLYVLAALIRLAYFNVQAEAGCAAGEKVQKVYYGLPVTSSALIFPTFLLLRHLICADIAIGYYAVMLLTALAFVCKFRMRKPTLRTVLIMVGIGGLEFLLILLVKYNGFRAF